MTRRRAFGTVERRKRKDGSHKPGFYAKFVWESRRYVRKGGPTAAHARKKLSAAQGLLEAGVPIGSVLSEVFGDFDGTRLSFKSAAALYLEYAEPRKRPSTFAADSGRLSLLCREPWANEYLSRITSERIARHVQQRMANDAKPATVNRELSAVSAVFKWAMLMGYVDQNPVKRVERPSERDSGREVYLTAAECHALLDAAEGVVRDILEFALGTGCRRGEILALRWRAVHIDERASDSWVRIEPDSSKSGKGRTITLTPDVFTLLSRRQQERPLPHLHGEDKVFVQPEGGRITLHAIRSGFASAKARATESAADANLTALPAKLEKMRFHDTRHTAASLMVGAGVPIFDVSKVLGHATIQMTMRYAHFAPEAGRAAIDALGRALARGA